MNTKQLREIAIYLFNNERLDNGGIWLWKSSMTGRCIWASTEIIVREEFRTDDYFESCSI